MISDTEDARLNKLFRAYKTVHEMLRDRGYQIADEAIQMSRDNFRAKVTD